MYVCIEMSSVEPQAYENGNIREEQVSIAKRGELGNEGGKETKFPSQEGRERKLRHREHENRVREIGNTSKTRIENAAGKETRIGNKTGIRNETRMKPRSGTRLGRRARLGTSTAISTYQNNRKI
jgi:hypothetical protein